MPDGNFHLEAFPTMKGQFFIYNYNTSGFRRFRFIKEIKVDIGETVFIQWLFESEDGIQCIIGITEDKCIKNNMNKTSKIRLQKIGYYIGKCIGWIVLMGIAYLIIWGIDTIGDIWYGK